MTVGELRAALSALPADMPVACTSTHLTSRMAAAVVRYHFAAREGEVRYADGLWIGWSPHARRLESGYSPELQAIVHNDACDPEWAITTELRAARGNGA